MAVTSVVAPYMPFYANREPYITPECYLNFPAGTDTTQLIPGGNAAQNRDALIGVIQNASSAADTYCNQVLAATVDLQSAPAQGWRVQFRSGRRMVVIPVDNTPVIQVTGIALGWDPSTVAPLADLTGVWVSRKTIGVPMDSVSSGPPGTTGGPRDFGGGGYVWGWGQYVNGFFNASLSAAVSAGAMSITPTDILGLQPGLPFTVYDTMFGHSEMCVVAAGYDGVSATVPLTAPLTYSHLAGTSVSALPPAVRQATISLTSALIKRRGGDSIVLASLREEPSRQTLGEPGMSGDEQLAYRLLQPFRRAA